MIDHKPLQVHTEHDVAFPQNDGDRLSRGEHFHNEALRLWALEENRPTLTNVQALCVLSLELEIATDWALDPR